MKTTVPFLFMVAFTLAQCSKTEAIRYTGQPFSDTIYKGGPQVIPGKIQCEYYDAGGEGIAYHDSDSTNSGSGGLNPADGSYLNEFRIREAVDISYTKVDERDIDNNPYNWMDPQKNQLYVGWTEPGEWMKYTIRVQKTGTYTVGLMYTSNRGGQISLSVDDQDLTGPVKIASTFVQEDPLDWRQWHHWNFMDNLAEMELKKGKHVLTLTTVAEGNMNYDYLSFILEEQELTETQ